MTPDILSDKLTPHNAVRMVLARYGSGSIAMQELGEIYPPGSSELGMFYYSLSAIARTAGNQPCEHCIYVLSLQDSA
jgi:hypothetical protein